MSRFCHWYPHRQFDTIWNTNKKRPIDLKCMMFLDAAINTSSDTTATHFPAAHPILAACLFSCMLRSRETPRHCSIAARVSILYEPVDLSCMAMQGCENPRTAVDAHIAGPAWSFSRPWQASLSIPPNPHTSRSQNMRPCRSSNFVKYIAADVMRRDPWLVLNTRMCFIQLAKGPLLKAPGWIF